MLNLLYFILSILSIFVTKNLGCQGPIGWSDFEKKILRFLRPNCCRTQIPNFHVLMLPQKMFTFFKVTHAKTEEKRKKYFFLCTDAKPFCPFLQRKKILNKFKYVRKTYYFNSFYLRLFNATL